MMNATDTQIATSQRRHASPQHTRSVDVAAIAADRRSELTVFRIATLLAAAAMLLVTGVARADSIKLGEFWLNGVNVSEFKAGKIIFVNAAGSELARPLKDLKGFRMDRYPKLGDAEEFYDDRNYKKALDIYLNVRGRTQANEGWLRHWLDYRTMRCYNYLGVGYEAVNMFLKLMDSNPDPFFVRSLPEESLTRMSKKQKLVLVERLTTIEKQARKGTKKRAVIGKLKELVGAVSGQENAPDVTQIPDGPGPGTTGPRLAPRRPSVILTPREMDKEEDDAVAALLRKGKFEEAKQGALAILAKRDIDSPSRRLYQLGLAQMHLARAEQNPQKKKQMYQDAGLSLMRVVIYYSQSTAWVGPALIDAGYVHAQIGRKDLARQLYDQADNYLDPDEEPELAEYRNKLVKELNQ